MKSKIFTLLIVAFLLFSIVGCTQAHEPSYTSAVNGSDNRVSNLPASIPTVQIKKTPALQASPDELSVLFINVGKGDSILVQYANKAYLIDTGLNTAAPQLIRALNLFNIDTLDVFLTHTDSDHIGGMETLARGFRIGTLYSDEISKSKKSGENKIEDLAGELSLTHKLLHAGDKVNIAQDVCFEVLGPLVYNEESENDNSLVLRLGIHGKTLLFTGDMQFAEEETLMNAGVKLSADILKVGHHGKPDATSDKFAAAVSPKYAVISTDISVAPDSANIRVKSALHGAAIYVTQGYPCGVLFTIQADGSIKAANPEVPKTDANLTIKEIDKDTQTISICNNGKGIDISGFFILSQDNSDVFVFPKHSYLNAGQTVRISRKDGGGDYEWADDGNKVWHGKKDTGILYDRYGNELSSKQEKFRKQENSRKH